MAVQGGGCSGFQYALGFDRAAQEGDHEMTVHGVDVVVDPYSEPYLRGTEIDFVDGLQGGFAINNPNVVAACGCGHSFQVDDETGEPGAAPARSAAAAPAARTNAPSALTVQNRPGTRSNGGRIVRTAYRYLSWLIFAAVIVQVGLAGYGAFNAANKAEDAHHDDAQTITLGKDTIEDGFGLHWAVGELILLLTLVALILAAVGGIRGRRLKLAGALFGCSFEAILGFLASRPHTWGALHPINAR